MFGPAWRAFPMILQADWEASPRWAGASGLFCQWTAIRRVAARLRTHHLRARPRRLFRCGSLSLSIILSSHWQTADKSRRLGRLSHRQSGPRMWSSTLQRSVRLGCKTALSKLRGMTSRPVSGRPTRQGLCMSIDTTIVVLPFQPKFERLRYSASQLRNDQRAARSP